MKKLLKYLNLDQVGFLELLLALYPILAAYKYGTLYMSHIVLIVLDVFIVFRSRTRWLRFLPLLLFAFYYLFHQIIYYFVFDLSQSYSINLSIGNLIFLISLFIIIPSINFEKFEGSINWVSLICLIGLYYQAVLVMRGEKISPIPLPFMPTPEISRLMDTGIRPESFFMEPQSYVSYMLFTLFFAIRNQKYVWAVLVGLSIILSTSTTGLAMLPIMIGLFVFLGKSRWSNKIIMGVLLAGLAFFLFNSEWAAFGLDKFEMTDLSENSRTANGVALASTMEISDMFFGVPYANATDYYFSVKGADINVFVDSSGGVFVSGFWHALIFFGITGLLLYMNIYWRILKNSREIIPILGCLIVTMFSNPDFIGAYWSFSIMYMISFVNRNQDILVIKNK